MGSAGKDVVLQAEIRGKQRCEASVGEFARPHWPLRENRGEDGQAGQGLDLANAF